jgi:hypothetical protein
MLQRVGAALRITQTAQCGSTFDGAQPLLGKKAETGNSAQNTDGETTND